MVDEHTQLQRQVIKAFNKCNISDRFQHQVMTVTNCKEIVSLKQLIILLFPSYAFVKIIIQMRAQQSKFKKQHDSKQASGELRAGSTLFNDKYVLAQLIGHGSFGEVYRGIATPNSQSQNQIKFPKFVGIKVQNDPTKSSISNQISVIEAIFKHHHAPEGFPKIYASGIESGHAFMIMDLLGPTLQDLMMLSGGKFTLKTSLLLIVQILERIELIHEIGYVYRDIKPENFVMGIGKRSKEVFMIDFGMCKRFRDQNTKLFLPYKETISMSQFTSWDRPDKKRRPLVNLLSVSILFEGRTALAGYGFLAQILERPYDNGFQAQNNSQLTLSWLADINIKYFYEDPDYRYIISELTYLFQNMCDLVDLEYDWEKLPQDAKLEKTNILISFPSNTIQDIPDEIKQNSVDSQQEIEDVGDIDEMDEVPNFGSRDSKLNMLTKK